MKRLSVSLLAISLTAALAFAGSFAAPNPPYVPTAEEKQQIRAKLEELAKQLAALRDMKFNDELLADVEVYHKAGDWIMRHEEEFFAKPYLANTLTVLDRGNARAAEARALAPSAQPVWAQQKGRLTRAYRSRVDGSVQPYGLIIPPSYDGTKPVRLDVNLHGRGATLNEVSFVAGHDSAREVPASQDFIQLDIFGRTNNVYRWAGETDVFEALRAVQKRYMIDPQRIVLRGFSMGGGGTWHLGLHYPDKWAAIEAGAGFTETKRYAKIPNPPPHWEAAMHIYDAADYALNVFDVPTVGYGGEDDAQLQATVNIRDELVNLGFHFIPDGLDSRTNELRALFLVGPKTGHAFHPESKKQSDAFINNAVAHRVTMPKHIRFVTYTTKYNKCNWMTVDELKEHYKRSEVNAQLSDDGKQSTIRTGNVSQLTLSRNLRLDRVTLDGQSLAPHPSGTFTRSPDDGKWVASDYAPARADAFFPRTGLRKRHNLQGPIDDAFMDSFLCVRPTGTPYDPDTDTFAKAAYGRFVKEWDKWMRGDLRAKDDTQVTKDDIANNNLILFGDPGSNKLIAQVIGKLPLKWTKTEIAFGSQKFTVPGHVPVLIYPNPLNLKKYVVINSGHTFGEAEFRGTNALLFPRLGDYAVLTLTGEVKLAGFFGERWELNGK